jgi:hypothetical protein
MLKINFNELPNKDLYVVIFKQDEDVAFSNNTEDFGAFASSSLSEFVYDLTETADRLGHYTSTDFSAFSAFNDHFKLHVEIREKVGGSYDWDNDILKGTTDFNWSHTIVLDTLLVPRLNEGTYLGDYNLFDFVRGEVQLYDEYGCFNTTSNPLSYAVYNPSGSVVGTGVLSFVSAGVVPYYTFNVRASGQGYGVGNYRLSVSGLYDDGVRLKNTNYFTVSTGIAITATLSATVNPEQLGYATGFVNDGSAGVTSFITSLGSSVDNFYNGQIAILPDTHPGQGRIVSAYVGSTKRITLNKGFSSAPASGSRLFVMPIGGELNVS